MIYINCIYIRQCNDLHNSFLFLNNLTDDMNNTQYIDLGLARLVNLELPKVTITTRRQREFPSRCPHSYQLQ